MLETTKLANKAKMQPTDSDVLIKVEGEGLESTTVSVRSDIDLAVRGGQGEALVFARDWKTGGCCSVM